MTLLLAGLALAEPSAPPPQRTLALGLSLPYLSQPGVVLGARQELGTQGWQWGLDLAGWVNPSDAVHGQLTPQLGRAWQRPSGLRLSGSLGLGLGVERRITEHALELGEGGSQRSWERQTWVVPELSTRLSWRHERRFPVFLDLSVGQQLAPQHNGGTVVTVDVGVLLSTRERS